MSQSISELNLESVRTLAPARPPDAHKGVFGHVLVIAGSRGFTGAARLAAEAASRSGVGLVTLAVPHSLADIAAMASSEIMTMRLPQSPAETFAHTAAVPAIQASTSRTAVVLGPGLSQHAETKAFVQDFARQCAKPLLIDADGLNCLGKDPELLKSAPARRVLTPHPGEMSRLTGLPVSEIQAKRQHIASEFARAFECVLVLKGHRTVIAEPGGPVYINTTGNSGLAKGGTGDVLAGFIGGLLAQGMPASDAARLGVYLHGLAGDLAAAAKTERGMIAGDVITFLPEAWKRLSESASS
ncbi:MAG: NAD(P)H-hydrate dehydratase [Candidatus Hydrogenedentes bacterium]|nr:NAD(P)H-hydrate dehydratase [Candidatus Hydrogenedentota bacterium]